MTKIIHYRENCIGCNSCVEINPSRWKMSKEDGKSNLIGGKKKGKIFQKEIDLGELEEIKGASASCPVNIIKITD